MKRFIQYALALTTVLLLTAVAPEAYAQNRAHNTTKNNTTSSQTTKKDTPSKSGNSSKPGGTTSSNRGSKDKKPTVKPNSNTKPASSTPSKPSSKPTAKPESKPGNHQPSNHQPSGTTTTSRSGKPSSQPSAKPGSKPSGSHNSGVKVGGHDDHKGNSPKPGTSHNPSNNKPSSQPSHKPDNGHQPGHQPDHKPGKYNGQYESRPTPGHDYGHHMPDRIDRKPGNFHPKPNYHHVDHYFGHFINRLPRGYHSRRYNKIRYYYYDGIYYRRINGYYCICRPPFGVRIAMSLFGYAPTAVWFSPYAPVIYDDCYCLDGVFYRLRGRYYHVIEPPIGAIIPQIPADYEVVMMNGETCYRVEDALYRMVVLSGRICFEVIANLAPRYY